MNLIIKVEEKWYNPSEGNRYDNTFYLIKILFFVKTHFYYIKPVLFYKFRFERELKENKEVYEDIQKFFSSNRVGNELKGQSVFYFFF